MVICFGRWTVWPGKLLTIIRDAWLGSATISLLAPTLSCHSGRRWRGKIFNRPAVSVVTEIALKKPGEILTCCASRTGCRLVFTRGSSSLCDTSGAFMLGSRLCRMASNALNFEWNGPFLRSPRKMPRLKRSMNDASSSKLTKWLGRFETSLG